MTEPRLRAMHVYAEADRVLAFQAACGEGHSHDGSDDDRISRLGALMTASHTSCRDLYDCSSPELEELVAVARCVC